MTTESNAKLFAKLAAVMGEVRTLEKTGRNWLRVNQHTAPSAPVRFWAKVDISNGPSACWIWNGYKDKLGYGALRVEGKLIKVHRFAWEFANEPIPSGLHVCHHCDNPSCVNPAHLFLGTVADNMRDRDTKGRGYIPTGVECHTHKLTPAQVGEIRALYAEGGITQRQLAQRFGITQAGIWAVVNNKAWRNSDGK